MSESTTEALAHAEDAETRAQRLEARVHELEAANDTLRTLIDTLPAAVLVAESHGAIILSNPAARSMLGGPVTGDSYGPQGGYTIERTDGSNYPPDELPLPRALHGEPTRNAEIVIARESGERVVGLVDASPVLDGEGRIQGAIATMTDITERKHREENAAFLTAISQHLARLSSSDEILSTVGEAMRRHFRVSRLAFGEVDEDMDTTTALYDLDEHGTVETFGTQRLSVHAGEAWLGLLRAGQVAAVDDIRTDPRTAARADRLADRVVRSQMVAPYLKDGELRSVIVLLHDKPHHWRNDEIELLQALAARVYPQIEIARAGEVLRKAHQAAARALEAAAQSQAELAEELADARQLHAISTQLIQEENPSALYEQVLDAAMAVMRADTGSMQVFDPERSELRLLAWRGFAPASAAFWQIVRPDSHTSCGAALSQGRRTIVPDVDHCDLMAGSDDLYHCHLSGIQSTQSTPLLTRGGQLAGMISTHWRAVHEPSERELRLLDVLARQAADLIERFRAESRARMAVAERESALEALSQARDELEQRVRERTEELADSREELRLYSSYLEHAIEDERRSLARELHDQAGQSLSALKMHVARLRQETDGDGRHALRFDEVVQLIDGVMVDLHRLAMNLRPASLDRSGLVPALRQYVESCCTQSGLNVDFEAVGIEEHRLPESVETALYRIVQEALTNVLRHAGANRAAVTLYRQAQRVVAIIEDDGQGFDVDEAWRGGRLGILGMRERLKTLGGVLTIESAPGKGTVVFANVPIPK